MNYAIKHFKLVKKKKNKNKLIQMYIQRLISFLSSTLVTVTLWILSICVCTVMYPTFLPWTVPNNYVQQGWRFCLWGGSSGRLSQENLLLGLDSNRLQGKEPYYRRPTAPLRDWQRLVEMGTGGLETKQKKKELLRDSRNSANCQRLDLTVYDPRTSCRV